MANNVKLDTDILVEEMFPLVTLVNYGEFEEESLLLSSEPVFYQEEETVADIVEEPVTENYPYVSTPSDSVETELAMNIGTPVEGGIVYSMEELSDFDFLVTNCYAVDSSTSVNPDELNAENLLSMDLSVDLSGDDYKVLIYHTHGSEAFADSRPGVTEDTIIGVGDELARILEEDYGIKVYHDRNVYDVIDGELDRSRAYDMSGAGVDAILAQYPSIEVVIDLHRDGVNEGVHLVTDIDGVPTAQIMFLNGVSRLNVNGDIDYLYNPNKIANLAFSLQMHLEGKRLYGDLMRRIYIRGYRFNLDKLPRATLVEVGAQTNTVQEVKNAMTPLAAIIYSVISQK
ncbi:MAG: stage II sporulation protein P [Lachnospiraceae bacterium]|nr:stage II sporulation protein P [Lachnospiraceae bacterium]